MPEPLPRTQENASPAPSDARGVVSAGCWCLGCVAIFAVAIVLLLTIIFFYLEIPHGTQDVSFRMLSVAVIQKAILPTIAFFAAILKSLFPWPVIALIALALVAWGPSRIGDLLSSAKIDIAGIFKFEGTTRTPIEEFKKEFGQAQRAVDRANKEIRDAYDTANGYVLQLRTRYGIPQIVSSLARDIATSMSVQCPDDYRFTLYIPDLVFDDRLYQFTEYYDALGAQRTNDKAGRTYSIRYGIIGRVWRSGVPEVEGELLSQEDLTNFRPKDGPDMLRFIARRWGLTLEEAVMISPYNSYGAVRVEVGGRPLGVVFFYAKAKNAFGDVRKLQKNVPECIDKSGLVPKILELNRELEPKYRIHVLRNS